MKTFSISIPKPCHEDWNKMTPDAKGAFCASCQKSVYDFSNKTDEEIISVFEKEESGKVCGRFTNSQLSRPVVSFGNPSVTSRLAIFAYALLMVFGAALFSGTTAYGQEMMKGEMKVKTMGKPSINTVKTGEDKSLAKCGLTKNPGQQMPLGQVTIRRPVEEPIRITGDTVIMNIPPIDTGIDIIEEDVIKILETEPVIAPEPYTMVAGGVSYVQIADVDPVVEEQVDTALEVLSTIEETEDVYPVGELLPVDEIIPVEPTNVMEEVVPVEEVVPLEEVAPVEEEIIPVEEDTNERIGTMTETALVPSLDFAVKVSPNPSRGEITLSYNLQSDMPVKIILVDENGKMVRLLSDVTKQYAGKYNSYYNISDLRNGTYNAVMLTSDRKVSAKVVLTK